ncbi:hypothetical protein F5Y12DRAFT_329542 [Xylaria sp. FL1777]|nr:hypothetical protein F5Y12DRAFT_329542 [Xylaria sp. FL1777]
MGTEYSEPTDAWSHISSGSICSYVTLETSRLVIDPDGDLSLKVGQIKCVNISPNGEKSDHCTLDSDHDHELPAIYTVCSRTLSRASPVWKALLYGGFAESKPSCASSASDWLVELPDDNPKAMATILNIIHSRFESIPRVKELVDIEDLYQLTVLTDKYDLTAILRPWASVWMEHAKEKWMLFSSMPQIERLSWIAWELGDSFLYGKATEHLAANCSVDTNGDLLYYNDNKAATLYSSTLEPPGLCELLKLIRLNSIKAILAVYGNIIEELLQRPGSLKPSTICKFGSETCEAAILGTMIRSLAWSGYWPLPVTTDVRMNLIMIWTHFKAINIQSPVHPECQGIKKKESAFLKASVPTVIFPLPIKERMAKQAAKSGCLGWYTL